MRVVVVGYEVFIAHSWLLLDQYGCFYDFPETCRIRIAGFENHCVKLALEVGMISNLTKFLLLLSGAFSPTTNRVGVTKRKHARIYRRTKKVGTVRRSLVTYTASHRRNWIDILASYPALELNWCNDNSFHIQDFSKVMLGKASRNV